MPVGEFEGWYRESYPRLYAALRLIARSADDAADAVSDAYTKAFEQWDRVQEMENPTGWAFKVALHADRRRGRRRATERRVIAEVSTRPIAPTADAALSELDAWVSTLPERMAQVVVLRHVGDLTEPAIAEVLGISRGTVSSTLRDAYTRLSAVIDRDGKGGRRGVPTDEQKGTRG